MRIATIKIGNQTLDTDELREILSLMETQDTTDKLTNYDGVIDGNHAKIEVSIDDDGNVELIKEPTNVVVVIKDGLFDRVYSNDPNLLIEKIDLDTQDPDELREYEKRLEELDDSYVDIY